MVVQWETVGLLVGHGDLLLGLRCDARDSRVHSGGLRSCFELSGDNPECSVLAASHIVQLGWGQPGLPGLGSVVECTEVKGPIDLEELVFPPAHFLEVSEESNRKLLEAAVTSGPKERALSMVTPRNFGSGVVLREDPSSCNEGCQRAPFEFTLASVEGKLLEPTPPCHVCYNFLYGCFSGFFIGVAAEE